MLHSHAIQAVSDGIIGLIVMTHDTYVVTYDIGTWMGGW